MNVSVRPALLGVSLIFLALLALPHPAAGQNSPPPTGSPQSPATQQPNSDYGAGGHSVTQNDSATGELVGTVYDPDNNPRRKETRAFTLIDGAEHKASLHAITVDPKGNPLADWVIDYDPRGGLTHSDVTHFGLHGERTDREVTDYRLDGYEIKDWSLGTHLGYTSFTPYKTPLPASPPSKAPLAPTNTNVGVLFPRSYLPGETVTGSLWPSTYAENFKVVPGLSEYSFPIQLYHLPDGSPEWSSLEIGVKGDGYLPVNANGTFSVHIPYDWKGPLQLQARQPDPVAGLGPANASIDIGNPVAAPKLSSDNFSPAAQSRLDLYTRAYLVSLWGDACSLEATLDELNSEPNPDWARIYAVEDDLDDVYGEIDFIEDDVSPGELVLLAQSTFQQAADYRDSLENKKNPSANDKANLQDAEDWVDFLHEEIGYSKFLAGWGQAHPLEQPFWTNPVITQGKLNEIGGSFAGNPYDTRIRIDNIPVAPLAATPNNWYYMPPAGLTAGAHNYIIDSPVFPETVFPVFYMTLTMSADALQLHKGQHTTWHLILDGLNGLPGSAWSGSSSPSDLVDPSELSAHQNAAGSSRQGYITLTVTNQSPAVISMHDEFRLLDASYFAPSGSFKLDGGIGAMKDGGFSVLGVARAYLQPEIGIGPAPGTSLSGGSSGYSPRTLASSWLPSFNLSYNPDAFSNSPFMTGCLGSAGAPPAFTPAPTGGKPSSGPCGASIVDDLSPRQSVPGVNEVQDNSPNRQLSHAAKRVEDAKKKASDSSGNAVVAYLQLEAAWSYALSDVPQWLQDQFKTAEEKLAKAEQARDKRKAAFNQTPSVYNAGMLVSAEQDVTEAKLDYDSVKQQVIERFDPEKRKVYEKAHAAHEKAVHDWEEADNERRAAEETLNKLQQSATVK